MNSRLRAVGADPALVHTAASMLEVSFRAGGKLLIFGNGGSAAETQHVAAELVGRFKFDRPPLPAIALTADSAVVTALTNDFGFEHVFARQVRGLGGPGDIAYAISTSGASANVLAGLREAAALGLRTICCVGTAQSELERIAEIAIVIPAATTAEIQEGQLVVDHAICELVEQALFGQDAGDRWSAPLVPASEKVVGWEPLLHSRQTWREKGMRVVWTNGCFDLLHAGHVRGLEAARSIGDVLIVGVNGDASVRELKGSGRPLVPASERAELVAAIHAVTRVVVFEESTPVLALERLRPDVHAKGADYRDKPMPERALVESYGGAVELLPMVPNHSTTEIARRLNQGHGL